MLTADINYILLIIKIQRHKYFGLHTVQSHQYLHVTDCVNKYHIRNLIIVISQYIEWYSL